MRDWLEVELARELRATKAPEELWERIENGAIRPAARSSWKPWPIAAVLTLTVASGMLWLVSGHAEGRGTVVTLASDEIAVGCTDPVRVHYWTVSDRVAAHSAVAHGMPRADHPDSGCGSCHTAL